MSDFLPCPFCGGTDIRSDRHHETRSPTGFIWSMCCYHCGATVPNRYKRELLVENWNRRPVSPAPAGEWQDQQHQKGWNGAIAAAVREIQRSPLFPKKNCGPATDAQIIKLITICSERVAALTITASPSPPAIKSGETVTQRD